MGPDGALTMRLRLPPGAHHDLVLEISDETLPDPVDPDRCWNRTENAWRSDIPSFDSTVAPRDAAHSYAILRGLTAPGGGMVAATTLGLPERARAGRDYDYRYVWLRDQAYAGIAAGVDQPYPLLDDAPFRSSPPGSSNTARRSHPPTASTAVTCRPKRLSA